MDDLGVHPVRTVPDSVAEPRDLYASNPAYWRCSGDFDPDAIGEDEVRESLRTEITRPDSEVLLARLPDGRLAALVALLRRHPVDGYPWIGLLVVHGDLHRRGIGRRLVGMLERRFGAEGRPGLRLGVLADNRPARAFWTALGYREIARRPDRDHGRPTIVLHKDLVDRRPAAVPPG